MCVSCCDSEAVRLCFVFASLPLRGAMCGQNGLARLGPVLALPTLQPAASGCGNLNMPVRERARRNSEHAGCQKLLKGRGQLGRSGQRVGSGREVRQEQGRSRASFELFPEWTRGEIRRAGPEEPPVGCRLLQHLGGTGGRAAGTQDPALVRGSLGDLRGLSLHPPPSPPLTHLHSQPTGTEEF